MDEVKEIKKLWDNLSSDEKVYLMVDLYYSLYDAEKDKFLNETEE